MEALTEGMNTSILDRRRAGMLVPVYALRRDGDLGVGDTAAVKDAIDFVAELGMTVLQLLPIHETFGDHSPYNPISSRALSPGYLTLTPEDVPGLTQGLLDQAAPEAWLSQLRSGNVRHESVYALKTQILLTASVHFSSVGDPVLHQEFTAFQEKQASWLRPFTLFRLLVREYEGNTVWDDWRPEHRGLEEAEAWLQPHPARGAFEALRTGFAFIQWVAWRQWKAVRAYAEGRDVRLMGEMSFGVGLNSADVWANPSLFDLEWSLGTRPLAHFDTSKDAERWGQNWGLPPYRWENHRSTGFEWLRGRIAWEGEFFHGCRLDHLRGYFRAYMFPWAGGARHVEFSNLTEEEASQLTGGLLPRFVPGPDDDPIGAAMNELQGREIIGHLIEAAGGMDLIAEIMGEMPEYMVRTLRDLELANLSFPQLERGQDGKVRPPDEFRELSLVAYANHDNAPLAQLLLHLQQKALQEPAGKAATDLAALLEFAGITPAEELVLDNQTLLQFQSALFKTRSRLAVLMCSDLLGIPLRFNLPGSYGRGTWGDRLDYSLEDLSKHSAYGPRIRSVSNLILDAGRIHALPSR